MGTNVHIGLGVAAVYAVAAVLVIRSDRRSVGSWINLSGLASGLATLPVAALVEFCGGRLNHRSNVQMAAAVLVTGAVVAGVVALIAWPFTG